MQGLLLLITYLPEILKLIKALQQAQIEKGTEASKQQTKADLDKIAKAFKEKDAQALNDLFSNKSAD